MSSSGLTRSPQVVLYGDDEYGAKTPLRHPRRWWCLPLLAITMSIAIFLPASGEVFRRPMRLGMVLCNLLSGTCDSLLVIIAISSLVEAMRKERRQGRFLALFAFCTSCALFAVAATMGSLIFTNITGLQITVAEMRSFVGAPGGGGRDVIFMSGLGSMIQIIVAYSVVICLCILVPPYISWYYPTDCIVPLPSTTIRRCLFIASIALVTVILSQQWEAWAPVTNVSILLLQVPFVRSISLGSPAEVQFGTSAGLRPNVVLFIHESASGLYLNSEEGRLKAPFIAAGMPSSSQSSSEFFSFTAATGSAGATQIAAMSILTGGVAFNDQGYNDMFGVHLGSQFKSQGYNTGLFSSYNVDMTGTLWEVMTTPLTHGFDVITDPASTGNPFVNEMGMDDRHTIGALHDWIETVSTTPKPFFAVVLLFNNHFPFVVEPGYVEKDAERPYLGRYMDSFTNLDRLLKQHMQFMEDHNLLESTVQMGCGDHGETPDSVWNRLGVLNAPVLNVFMWFHIPDAMLSADQWAALTSNRDAPVASSDLIHTMFDVMQWRPEMNHLSENAILGQSLLRTVPSDRIVLSLMGPPLHTNHFVASLRRAGSSKALVLFSDHNPCSYIIDYDAPISFEGVALTADDERFWADIVQKRHPELIDRFLSCNSWLAQ